MENSTASGATNSKAKENEKLAQKPNLTIEKPDASASIDTKVTSPTTSPSTSRSPNSAEVKKSYKLALTKEPDVPIVKDQPERASENKPEEKPEQTEPISSEQMDKKNVEDERKASGNVAPKTVPPQTWKNPPINSAANKKKKGQGEEEPLTDLTAWPSLDAVKSDSKEKKKESKRDEPEKVEKAEPVVNTTNTPDSPTSETASDPSNSKKKPLNWVPFEIEHQRQPSSRGRGGPRGPRPPNQNNPNNPNNPMNRPSWRSQGPIPNQRGSRRGRGGYNGMRQNFLPSATVFYTVPLDPENLKQALLTQIEYYFSIENLCKDMYLRGHMDEEGFLPLSLIAGFPKIKQLTTDMQFIIETLQSSTIIEYKEEKIRKKDDWKTWVPPKTTEPAKVV